jgi:serine/threonine protein kinase
MNELQQVIVILFMFLILAWGVNLTALNYKKAVKSPKGLGGWLILVGLGLILSPFILFAQVSSLYGEMLEWEDGTWDLLTTPGTEYYIEWFGSLVLAELAIIAGMLLFALTLIYLFFKKHYRFPNLYIYFLALPIITIPINAFVVSSVLDVEAFDSETTKDYVVVWVNALIWIPYMLVSKRVKFTFVEGRTAPNIGEEYLQPEKTKDKVTECEKLGSFDNSENPAVNFKEIEPTSDSENLNQTSTSSVQENQQPLSTDTHLEYFKIIKYLARGGFGITYLALDTKRNRPVVIKEYFPSISALRSGSDSHVSLLSSDHSDDYQEGLRRFKREAMTLNEFKHPNIVEVIAYFEANNTAYFVMEYVEGESLEDKLKAKNGQPFTEAEINRDFLPILKGLKQIHSIDLLHLDIKPDNIIQTKFGEPLLIDFGGARFATGQASHDHSSMVATTGYAPPEQYSLSQEQTPASDIYAFGMTLYQLMTGCKQGGLPDSKDRQNALLEDLPDPLEPIREAAPGFSETLYKIVDACTQTTKRKRPRSESEISVMISDDQTAKTQYSSQNKSMSEKVENAQCNEEEAWAITIENYSNLDALYIDLVELHQELAEEFRDEVINLFYLKRLEEQAPKVEQEFIKKSKELRKKKDQSQLKMDEAIKDYKEASNIDNNFRSNSIADNVQGHTLKPDEDNTDYKEDYSYLDTPTFLRKYK